MLVFACVSLYFNVMHDKNILNDDIPCDYENESKDILKPHSDVFIQNFVLVTNVPQSVIHLTMPI